MAGPSTPASGGETGAGTLKKTPTKRKQRLRPGEAALKEIKKMQALSRPAA